MLSDDEDNEILEPTKKPKTKVTYLALWEYDEHFAFYEKEKRNFTTEKTTYTKKIKSGNEVKIFNNEGRSDFQILALINKVRNDAKKWLEKNPFPLLNKEDIFWSRLTEKPPNTVISKIDLNGAYWNAALNRGIITDKTNYYLQDNFDKTDNLKEARLKSLGSLATRKEVTQYISGEEHERKIVSNETSRHLYMFLCQQIDDLMQDIAVNMQGAFFYYWDCIFTSTESTYEVQEYIRKQKFNYKTKQVTQTMVDIGNHKYIQTIEDDKMYLIQPEHYSILTADKQILHRNK